MPGGRSWVEGFFFFFFFPSLFLLLLLGVEHGCLDHLRSGEQSGGFALASRLNHGFPQLFPYVLALSLITLMAELLSLLLGIRETGRKLELMDKPATSNMNTDPSNPSPQVGVGLSLAIHIYPFQDRFEHWKTPRIKEDH